MVETANRLAAVDFFLWAAERGRRVYIHCGENTLDAMAEFMPWFPQQETPGESSRWRDGVHVLATQVQATPASESRHLRWPPSHLDQNHWHIAVMLDEEPTSLPAGHAPCMGSICAGDDICVGLLLDDLSPRGLVPLPTACDGDCGVDVCLFWEGRSRDRDSRLGFRQWVADAMWDKREDPQWMELYDSMVLPTWVDQLEILAVEDLAPVEPEPDCANCPPAEPLTAEQQQLHDAMAWACKDIAGVTEADVIALADSLTPESANFWIAVKEGDDALEQPRKQHARGALPQRTRRNRNYSMAGMAKLAAAYIQALRASASARPPRGFVVNFLKSKGISHDRNTRNSLHRAVKRIRHRACEQAVSKENPGRRRIRGRQGFHLIKAPALREELFQWFCQVRGLCKGRLPLKVLECKARSLHKQFVKAALAARLPPRVPAISSTWLHRFRRDYSISLRAPNRRWKVPRWVLLHRLKVMWSNTIRLRCLALVLLGYDLSADGFDQKPFHLCEAGSKGQRTLACKGAPEVVLKEISHASRARWTANTWVTSRPATALAGPPLEVLFKGGDQVLAQR